MMVISLKPFFVVPSMLLLWQFTRTSFLYLHIHYARQNKTKVLGSLFQVLWETADRTYDLYQLWRKAEQKYFSYLYYKDHSFMTSIINLLSSGMKNAFVRLQLINYFFMVLLLLKSSRIMAFSKGSFKNDASLLSSKITAILFQKFIQNNHWPFLFVQVCFEPKNLLFWKTRLCLM